MVHVGTPNSRHLYESTPQPGRTMADCASDARTICAALGIDRLAMWGFSGGGPPLLACTALLPDLVTAAASLSSPAPFHADGLDWLAGMGPEVPGWVALMFADWAQARAVTVTEREEMLAKSPAELSAAMNSGLSAEDDNFAQVIGWGFDLADISVPVLLMHGRLDEAVPVAHGQWLAAHIPGVEARLLDDEDHTGVREHHIGEVHAWLADRF
jgi:pimeloyl-ACP methyl ester carboxylesterase